MCWMKQSEMNGLFSSEFTLIFDVKCVKSIFFFFKEMKYFFFFFKEMEANCLDDESCNNSNNF